MFYKVGVDISNDKQMFNFLKNHFEYPTMNSWNHSYSIANNVKMYKLDLSGNWSTALCFLENGEYDSIIWMIEDWCREHEGYRIFFNGRSSGYLVLCEDDSRSHVLSDAILDSDTYEDYKAYCKEYYGSVKNNHSELVFLTKLVQDFDKLCDRLREYCDILSNLKFEVVEMHNAVNYFNASYEDDLELLGFKPLTCDADGKVDISEIQTLKSLLDAFLKVANRSDVGYVIKQEGGTAFYSSQH